MNPDRTAPISERPPHSENTLERLAEDALQRHSVLPKAPGPVPIERLIEEAFGFNEAYENLEAGVLGETWFGTEDRPVAIRVARRLAEIKAEDPSIDHDRRLTLAHECGHGLAHARLFGDGLRLRRTPRLPGFDDELIHISCRDRDLRVNAIRPTGLTEFELWIEWEANYLMGALLMPRSLVLSFLGPWLTGSQNGVAPRALLPMHRQDAVAAMAHAFNVAHEVAAGRLAQIVPSSLHPDLFDSMATSISVFRKDTRLQVRTPRSTRRSIRKATS
jgi:Zn-dependent peptidase ImmA (M78 family)